MSKTANKTLIGLFVVGGIALLVAAIAVFGSGKLFLDPVRFVLLFDSSISGLSVGAPVMFRGVPIGRVSQISLTSDYYTMKFQTPVFIELNQKEGLVSPKELHESEEQEQVLLDRLIAHGLRARLATQSILTGQLMIELDFFHEDALTSVHTQMGLYENYPLIPTIPSRLDNAFQALSALPIKSIAMNLYEITTKINEVLQSTDGKQLFSETIALIKNTNEVLTELKRVPEEMDKTLQSLQKTATQYNVLANHIDQNIDETLDQATAVLVAFEQTMTKSQNVLVSAQSVIDKNSPVIINLNQMLRELTEAARAIRVLASTLERNPESLLQGKK